MTGDIWHNPEVVTCEGCPVPLETIVLGMLGVNIANHRDAINPLLDATAQGLHDSENAEPPFNTSERLQAIRAGIFDKAALLGATPLQYDDESIAQFRSISSAEQYCDQVGRNLYESGCPKFETLLNLLSKFIKD